MPTKLIVKIRGKKVGFFAAYSYAKSTVVDLQARISKVFAKPINRLANVSNIQNQTKNVTRKHYSIITPSEILPFRIRFTTINIRPYDARNPAPVGIAVIGVNNYIL